MEAQRPALDVQSGPSHVSHCVSPSERPPHVRARHAIVLVGLGEDEAPQPRPEPRPALQARVAPESEDTPA